MSRALFIAGAVSSICLLAMAPFAFDEISWRSWEYGAENNFFRIFLVLSPACCLAICYLALRENFVSLVQLTLHRRKLEAQLAILEAQSAISTMSIQNQKNESPSSNFIRLWTAASSTPSYDKEAWLSIERQLKQAGAI